MQKKLSFIVLFLLFTILLISAGRLIYIQQKTRPEAQTSTGDASSQPTPSNSEEHYWFDLLETSSKKETSEVYVPLGAPKPDLADIDITYIERTPRYTRYCVVAPDNIGHLFPELCPDKINEKHIPEVGEILTYIGHIINKGRLSAVDVRYQWQVNGILKEGGVLGQLAGGEEKTVALRLPFSSTNDAIELIILPNNREVTMQNNRRRVSSHDLSFLILIERGLYEQFNSKPNLIQSYSFEDWIQAQVDKMNTRFASAQYTTSPNGILDRVHIDAIWVREELDGLGRRRSVDEDVYDGAWAFTDGDPTNQTGFQGAWQNYVNKYIQTTDWGLVHELGHQLGLIDIYRLNHSGNSQNNWQIYVKDKKGQLLTPDRLPVQFPCAGIMGGGDVTPYCSEDVSRNITYFDSHSAGGLNSHAGRRRGYYGEYLFDTPQETFIQILTASGTPISNATVSFYQKDLWGQMFDNIPEITAQTDQNGQIHLPNRPVVGGTTATGHTLRPNPFGQIDVVGNNGSFIVKITTESEEDFTWLNLTDLNLEYWKGNRDQATVRLKTRILGSGQRETSPIPPSTFLPIRKILPSFYPKVTNAVSQ